MLALCRDTHQFFMSIAPRVSEARRREEEGTFFFFFFCIIEKLFIIHTYKKFFTERKVLRDCYMYPARTTRGSKRADQRISLISSTSSNTTSGIVSDRVHSEDEPDSGPSNATAANASTIATTGSTVVDDSPPPSSSSSPPPPPLPPHLAVGPPLPSHHNHQHYHLQQQHHHRHLSLLGLKSNGQVVHPTGLPTNYLHDVVSNSSPAKYAGKSSIF